MNDTLKPPPDLHEVVAALAEARRLLGRLAAAGLNARALRHEWREGHLYATWDRDPWLLANHLRERLIKQLVLQSSRTAAL